MGTLDTVLMLGAVAVGGYILYQNWGSITSGMQGGGGGFFQQTYAQQQPTWEQPQAQEKGDCAGAGTGYCCTDNAGNRCYKGSTSQGVKYECDTDAEDVDCNELRDRFVDQWALENQPKAPSGKTNLPTKGAGKCARPCPKGDAACGLCCGQGGIWQPTNKCCSCGGKKLSQVKCCAVSKAPAPKTSGPSRQASFEAAKKKVTQCEKFTGATRTACYNAQAEYYGMGAGYGDQLAFEETLNGAPGRCQHLTHSPAAYDACVRNHVGAYTYGPNDGTYQNYEDLDEYGSYSTYWNINRDVAGRAPMRITFG